ncbi:MAG: GTPase ObgE [Clostridiaceae bacterium]
MFIDKAKIFTKSGNGGNGSASFRREKYIPYGGPDGGDGGDGGSVFIVGEKALSTLLDLTYKRKYVAEKGGDGSGAKCSGKKGDNYIIKVPLGTIVKDYETGKVMADISHEGDEFLVAKGGRKGRGNIHFATPTRQAPNFAEPGMPGEEKTVLLELKLIADVGLLGFPNVGKSTLLSVVSKATPKIANYHFTTLKPNLGVVKIPGGESFVMADIPGIIEGASEGVGLGLEFLRHIERTRLLVHLVDISSIEGRDPVDDFMKINEELKNYSEKLSKRPQIVVANKADMLYDDSVFENFKTKINKMGYNHVFKMSAVTTNGVSDLIKKVAEVLVTIPKEELVIEDADRYVEEDKRFTYTIKEENRVFIIEGSFVDRLLDSVNVNDYDSLKYFHKVLKNKGILDELKSMGIQDEEIVRLNNFEFEYMI